MQAKLLNNQGMTLLEVLISMIILSVGILGLAPMIVLGIYGNSYSSNLTEANYMAQLEIETLLAQDTYGTMPFVSISDSVAGRYRVVRTVNDNSTDATTPAGLYKIVVAVEWLDGEQQTRNVYLSTLKPSF